METTKTQEERRLLTIARVLGGARSIAWRTRYGECHLFVNARDNFELHLSRLDKDKKNGEIIVYSIDKTGQAKGTACFSVKEGKITIDKNKEALCDIETLLEITTEPQDVPVGSFSAEYALQIVQAINYFREKTSEKIDAVYDLSPQTQLSYPRHFHNSPIMSSVEEAQFSEILERLKLLAVEFIKKRRALPENIFDNPEFIDIATQIWIDAPQYYRTSGKDTDNDKQVNIKVEIGKFIEAQIQLLAIELSKEFPEEKKVFPANVLKRFRRFFIKKIIEKAVVADPRDQRVLQKYAENIGPEIVNGIAAIGGQDRKIVMYDAADHEQTYRFYGHTVISEGGFGTVVRVFYLVPGSEVLQEGVMKIPAPTSFQTYHEEDKDLNRGYFEFDEHMGGKFAEIIRKNNKHPGAQHIIKPIGKGQNFILLPIIRNSSFRKTPKNLVDVYDDDDLSGLLKNLGDIAEAYALLAQNRIVSIDSHPGNVLIGNNGAVLIDLGGFLDIADPKAFINEHGDGDEDENSKKMVMRSTKLGELGYAHSEAYNDRDIIVQEFEKSIPCDVSAKLSLAMMIIQFLICKEFIKENFLEIFKKTPTHKKKEIKAPALAKGENIAEIRELYDLSILLFEARHHTDEDDPKYISLEETAEKLYRLSHSAYSQKKQAA